MGRLLSQFEGSSRLEVARKLVPAYYDAFRLLVSPSYREQFDRTLNLILQRQGWRIVQTRTRGVAAAAKQPDGRLLAPRVAIGRGVTPSM